VAVWPVRCGHGDFPHLDPDDMSQFIDTLYMSDEGSPHVLVWYTYTNVKPDNDEHKEGPFPPKKMIRFELLAKDEREAKLNEIL